MRSRGTGMAGHAAARTSTVRLAVPSGVRLRFCLALVVLLAASAGVGCHRGSPQPAGIGGAYYPPRPASPRIVHLTAIHPGNTFGRERAPLARFLFGPDERDADGAGKPFGLTAADGKLYVCDTQRRVVYVLDHVTRRRILLGEIGPGRLTKPVAVATDEDGRVFVADAGRGQVVVYSPTYEFRRSIGALDGRPFKPVDVAWHAGSLYVLNAYVHAGSMDTTEREGDFGSPSTVADATRGDDQTRSVGKIEVIDPSTGALLRTIEAGIAAPLFWPCGLAVAQDGRVLVTDVAACQVHVFAAEGGGSSSFGGPGDRAGRFARPRHLDVGPDGTLFVVDAAFGRVQMFDRQGRLLMSFGREDALADGGSLRDSPREPGELVLPAGVCTDRSMLPEFARFVPGGFTADYLIFVSDQAGRAPVHVYAFGRSSEGK